MVAARLTGCFSREDIRRVVSLRYGIDPARRQPAPLRQCPVRRAFSDPALPQGGPRAWPLSYLAGRKLLHGPFRHGGRAFRIHGPSRMGQQNAERYRKALLAQRHPPVGRRHGHPRHARHGRRQNGLRRTPVRTALRLHCRWSLRLDITAYGPLSGHKYATRPERRRAGRAVLEVGAVALPADASHT